MTTAPRPIALSVIIAVVGGKDCLRRCLAALCPQIDFSEHEIIVPYDHWSREVAELHSEFPAVRFHEIRDAATAPAPSLRAFAHQRYDCRRAVGLGLARGELLALTEDYAVPAADWCRRVLQVHEQPYSVIGGAIDNGVDRALNWALYYCDFGRYGRPLTPQPAAYVSDVNVAYKRSALEAVRALWCESYHETSVHWALQARGEVLFLDPRLVVQQHRPPISFRRAYRERIDWGRAFAQTRAAAGSGWRRLVYAASAPLLPVLLLARAVHHMGRQGRSIAQMTTTIPLVFGLLTGWAWGEFLGYAATARGPQPDAAAPAAGVQPATR
ncbi:MAG: hypothetical protein HY699_12805 [Deltaproteobacteria bacterium]|nr:hypothetical protein [Deltaproteobacteria bacterium]